MRLLPIVVSLAFIAPAVSHAQMTAEQVFFSAKRIQAPRWSPDGKRVAFVVVQPVEGAKSSQDVWLADPKGGAVRLTTTETASDAQWSPDGKQLSFLSASDGKSQIYVAPAAGGEAVRLSNHGAGIRAFEWSPDGKRIAFIANEPKAPKAPEASDHRIVKFVSGSDVPSRLWILDVASKQIRQLTSAPYSVSTVTWKPDNQGLVAIATDRLNPEMFNEKVYSIALSDGAFTPIVDPKGPVDNVQVSPNGKLVSYLGPHVDGPRAYDLYVVPANGGEARNLTGAAIDRQVDTYVWKDNSTLTAMVESGFTNKLYTVRTNAQAMPVDGFDIHATSIDIARSGDLAYTHESGTEFPEIWFSKGNGANASQVTKLNAALASLPLVKPELVRYKSFDGLEIEAQVFKPKGPASAKYPTIFQYHGGPVGRWEDRVDAEAQFYASHGYAVMHPNIRGASSYGHRIIDLIRSEAKGGLGWGRGPIRDAFAAADYAVQSGFADPNRLGLVGWSYGGHMVGLGLGLSDRFKVGVAGAGFFDMLPDLGTEIASYVPGDEWMYGRFFDDGVREELHMDSAITYVKNVRVPVLLLHGELDPVDPVSQVYEYFRALQKYGVTTELVIYPREGHSLREQAHMVDRMNRTLAWLDKYLKSTAPAQHE